jgi:hypothetical protein
MHKSLVLTLFILFSSFTIQAIPKNFDCSVKNFVSTSRSEINRDKEFVNANFKKRFVISVAELEASDQEVIVTSISDSYSSGIYKYEITDRDLVSGIVPPTITANGMGAGSRSDTIVIDTGTGNATITHQSDSYLNVWFLDCKE